MGDINTGVDKLITLIRKVNSISVKEASRKLGVSKQVVLEWAEMLDEENVINIDYKLFDTIISLKKVTSKDIKNKEKEYSNHKDAFVRKIDSALTSLDSENEGLKKLEQEFSSIRDKTLKGLSNVQEKISKLEKYQELKQDIDKEMIIQKKDFDGYISKINQKIESEKSQYASIIKKINLKESQIEKDKNKTEELIDEEKKLQQKIDNIIEHAKLAKKELLKTKTDAEVNNKELIYLKKEAERIKQNIINKRKDIEKIIKSSKNKEEKIFQLQKEITDMINEKSKDMSNDNTSREIKRIFQKKDLIQNKILELEKEHKDLDQELKVLKKKAISLKAISGQNTNINNIEKEFEKLSEKKEKYQKDMKELIKIIK